LSRAHARGPIPAPDDKVCKQRTRAGEIKNGVERRGVGFLGHRGIRGGGKCSYVKLLE
jgi:hypothetical protein